jgi:hypothetical protein
VSPNIFVCNNGKFRHGSRIGTGGRVTGVDGALTDVELEASAEDDDKESLGLLDDEEDDDDDDDDDEGDTGDTATCPPPVRLVASVLIEPFAASVLARKESVMGRTGFPINVGSLSGE